MTDPCICRRDARGVIVDECARCLRLIDAADYNRRYPLGAER